MATFQMLDGKAIGAGAVSVYSEPLTWEDYYRDRPGTASQNCSMYVTATDGAGTVDVDFSVEVMLDGTNYFDSGITPITTVLDGTAQSSVNLTIPACLKWRVKATNDVGAGAGTVSCWLSIV